MQKARCALSRYREDRNTEVGRYMGGKKEVTCSKSIKMPTGQGAVRFFLHENKSRRNKKENSVKLITPGRE